MIEQSLAVQVAAVASARISAVNLTQKYIERIEELNPNFNIVIRKDFARARMRARELDKSLRETGRPIGPLHGIPFTIKDAFRVRGLGTSFGLPGTRLVPAFSSCQIVERLRAAGAILLGQTNVPFS